MKKTFLVIVCSFLLLGCSKGSTLPETPQKTGDTTKTGIILKIGAKYYIQESGKQPSEVDSYAINFSSYVNKNVTVAGQYSGDTLFVGKIDAR